MSLTISRRYSAEPFGADNSCKNQADQNRLLIEWHNLTFTSRLRLRRFSGGTVHVIRKIYAVFVSLWYHKRHSCTPIISINNSSWFAFASPEHQIQKRYSRPYTETEAMSGTTGDVADNFTFIPKRWPRITGGRPFYKLRIRYKL